VDAFKAAGVPFANKKQAVTNEAFGNRDGYNAKAIVSVFTDGIINRYSPDHLNSL